MTLGELIDRLERETNHPVAVGFDGFHSWRGIYAEVAFAPAENVSVDSMLICALAAVGATCGGYKGGEYTFTRDTDCHLTSDYGDYNGNTDDAFSMRHLELMLRTSGGGQ